MEKIVDCQFGRDRAACNSRGLPDGLLLVRLLGRPGGDAVEHAMDADVLVEVGPMHAFAAADDLVILALLWCRAGEPPGPDERHAD